MGNNILPSKDGVGQHVRVTKITATDRATKHHTLDAAGEIVTDSAPLVYAGSGEVLTLPPTLDAVAEVLVSLPPNECLVYGVPKHGRTNFTLTTKKRRTEGDPDAISRSRDCFEWGPGLGVLFIDHDPGPNGAPTPEELVQLLTHTVPTLAGVRWLVWPSSSSYLKGPDGGVLHDIRGFHLYTLIEARRIEPFASHLRDALAAAGHVRFDVTAAGSLVERYPVDFAVHQPERIDFAAAPVVSDGLTAFGREPRFIVGGAA